MGAYTAESALNRMGASVLLFERLQPGERLNRVVDETYKAFSTVLGVEKPDSDDEAEIVATRIIDHLRGVLGVKELTSLRQSATHLALRRVIQGGG
jgi:hypothetical protein